MFIVIPGLHIINLSNNKKLFSISNLPFEISQPPTKIGVAQYQDVGRGIYLRHSSTLLEMEAYIASRAASGHYYETCADVRVADCTFYCADNHPAWTSHGLPIAPHLPPRLRAWLIDYYINGGSTLGEIYPAHLASTALPPPTPPAASETVPSPPLVRPVPTFTLFNTKGKKTLNDY